MLPHLHLDSECLLASGSQPVLEGPSARCFPGQTLVVGHSRSHQARYRNFGAKQHGDPKLSFLRQSSNVESNRDQNSNTRLVVQIVFITIACTMRTVLNTQVRY